MAALDYHSNLSRAGQMNNAPRHAPQLETGMEIADIDATPTLVAAIGGLALVTLILLKRFGFRFDFGVSASAGK